jgi:antitoxin HicB
MAQKKIFADTIQILKDEITYEVTPVEEGGYVIRVLDYPSCLSQGETIDEALAQGEDALLGCLIVDREEGLPLPDKLEAWLTRARERHAQQAQDASTHRAYHST